MFVVMLAAGCVAVGVAACGGSSATHALHARQVPHTVPPISVEVTTTTAAPPETTPPTTAGPPPAVVVQPPLLDCYSVVLNLWGNGWEALHHNPPADLLAESLHAAGRDDCQGLLSDDATMHQIREDFWRTCRATLADPAADCPFVPG